MKKIVKCPFCRAHTKKLVMLLLHYYKYHPRQFQIYMPIIKRKLKVKAL